MLLSDLPEQVLAKMGVLATGETVNVADAKVITDKYSALYDMLLTDGMVAWTSTDDLPHFAELPIVAMLAHLCAPDFGLPQAKRAELEIEGALNLPPNRGGPSLAETQLRRQLAKGFVYYPMSTEFF